MNVKSNDVMQAAADNPYSPLNNILNCMSMAQLLPWMMKLVLLLCRRIPLAALPCLVLPFALTPGCLLSFALPFHC